MLTSILHDEPQEAVPTPHVDDVPQDVIRVLHVDDESDQRMMVKLFLERNDPALHVESAASPDEAFHMLESQVFSCIVSDYVMLGMNGIELARRVRETSTIPFILYTGQGSEEVASTAFAAGVDDYLRKEMDPSHYEVLAKRVRTAVEKRWVENALLESERKYRLLVQDSRDGVMVFIGKELVFANKRAAALHGCDGVEELMKIDPSAFLHPDDRQYVEERSLARQRGEDISPLTEFRLVLPDGTVRHVESSSSRIQYDGKNSTLAFIRDITDRKQMEKALWESENYSKNILDSILTGVVIIDEETHEIVDVNPTALEIIGASRGQVIGKICHEFICPAERDRCPTSDLGQTVDKSERVLLRADGERIPILNTGTSVDLKGRKYLIDSFIDITERKLFEERLQSLHIYALELNRATTIDEVYRLTFEVMDKILGFETIDVIKVEDGKLRDVHVKGKGKEPFELPITGSGITVRAVITGEPQYVPNVVQDPDYNPGRTDDMMSEFAVPVMVDGKAVAVLNVESPQIDAFNKREREMLETVGLYIASALRHIRQVDALSRQEKSLTELHDSAHRLAHTETVKEVVEVALDTLRRSLHLEVSSCLAVEDGCLVTTALEGAKDRSLRLPLEGPGVTVKAARTGETQLVPDTRLESAYVEGSILALSEIAVPVKVEGDVVAVLNVESVRVNAYDDNDRRLMETLAQHVALAIQRLRHIEVLQASEERWRTLLEASMDAVTVNVGTKLVYVNKRLADLLGYSSPSKLIGRDITELFPPEWRNQIRERTMRRQLGEEELTEYETVFLRRDGAQIDIETMISVIEFEGETATLAFIRDITERKQIEKEFIFKNALLEAESETSPDGILVVDSKGKTILFNKRFGEMWSIPPEIIETRSHKELIQNILDKIEEPEAFLEKVEYLYEHEDEKSRDEIELKDGTVFDMYSSPLLGSDDVYYGRIWFFRDITERKWYEKRLKTLHASVKELSVCESFEEVYDIVLKTVDQVLGFQFGGIARIEGDVIRYFNVFGVSLPDDWTIPLEGPSITGRVFRTGVSQLIPDIRLDPDYTTASPETSVPQMLSELTVPVILDGLVEMVINIESTRLNAFTQQDQELLETLAQHVASAVTVIRHRKELQRSLEEVERSNRELDDYTHVVSHDLKAPLRSITAFSSFLLEDYLDKLDETGQEYLRRIGDASNRMDQFIQDLLVLSRVGRKFTDEESVDLKELVETIKLDFEVQLEETGAEILIGELPTIRSQKVWVRQLFANLIGNGLKFNMSSSPLVEVGCEERKDDYFFSVKDNGIGIREEDQSKIFRLFQRLHTQDEFEGTGAGLAICKKIVESFRGKIWVKSKPGAGSIFYFIIPKEERPGPTQGRTPRASKGPPGIDSPR